MTELQKKLVDYVCDYVGINPDSLFTKSRKREIMLAKHVCMYVFKKKFGLTHNDIGKLFPREGEPMDHTSVMHAYRTVEDCMDVNDESVSKYVRAAMDYVDIHFSLGESEHNNNLLLISFHKNFEVDKLLKLIKKHYPTVQYSIG